MSRLTPAILLDVGELIIYTMFCKKCPWFRLAKIVGE